MKYTEKTRKIILSLSTLVIISLTAFIFHYTQPAYKLSTQGIRHFSKHRFKEALPFLLSAYNIDPRNMQIAEYLADLYYGLSDYRQAEVLYRKVLTRISKKSVKMKLAEVLAWQKKYDEVITIAEELMKDYPRNLELIEFSADVYAWTNRYDRAIELYKKLLSYHYHKEDLLLRLADTLRYAGKDKEATEIYKQYIDQRAK